MRGLLPLLVPALLLALAVYLEPSARAIPPDQAGLLRWAGVALAAAGLLFAGRFHRSRVFFGLLALELAAALAASGLASGDVLAAAAVLLPLDLALFALLAERGILTPGGASRFLLLALEVGAVAVLAADPPPAVSAALRHAWFPVEPIAAATPLPQPALLALNVAAVLLLARHMARPSPDTGALAGALLASALALHRGLEPAAAGLHLGAGALMLVLAAVETTYRMAFLDELTGLPGRRALGDRLAQLGSAYVVAMADVDHFKKLNDTYGHDVGDDCLRMVAGKLSQVGGGGEAFRYGGEEFAVVFAGRTVGEALPSLEALRAAIEGTPFRPHRKQGAWNPLASSKTVKVTVSIGAAAPGADAKDPWAVVKAADEALYRAKKEGRNRVAA
jgi:diguanylate cyclase (GGDEF)-like protein